MSSQHATIRPCNGADFDAMHSVINAAATAYAGVIPADCYHVPYMPADKLRQEIAAGGRFWGWRDPEGLSGVMGIQDVDDVTLIRHAYVTPERRGVGIGSRSLTHLLSLPHQPPMSAPGPSASTSATAFGWSRRRRRTARCGATRASPSARSTRPSCCTSSRADTRASVAIETPGTRGGTPPGCQITWQHSRVASVAMVCHGALAPRIVGK